MSKAFNKLVLENLCVTLLPIRLRSPSGKQRLRSAKSIPHLFRQRCKTKIAGVDVLKEIMGMIALIVIKCKGLLLFSRHHQPFLYSTLHN